MTSIKSAKLTGHNGSIYALSVCDQNQFYSGAGDGWIAEWNLSSSKDGRLIAEINDRIFALHKMKETPWMVAGTMSGLLYFINIEFPDQIRSFEHHKNGVFAFIQLEERLLVAGGDGRLTVWNWMKQELLETINLSHKRLRGLAISPDRQVLAVGASDGNIYLLHIGSWKVLEVITGAHLPSVFTVAFSLDGQQLISGGRDAHLKVWSVYEGFALVQDLPAHWYTINAMDIHHQGKLLATASRDKTVRIWNLNNFQLLQTLDVQKHGGHINSVNDICWTPDSDQLISAGDDRSIIVWDLADLTVDKE